MQDFQPTTNQMVSFFFCVNRFHPLDNAVFLYYLCSDILFNQRVNPMKMGSPVGVKARKGRQLTTPLL
jgi:hypothetical protein